MLHAGVDEPMKRRSQLGRVELAAKGLRVVRCEGAIHLDRQRQHWSVGPHDVFPEQFERFLVADPHSRALFMQYHGDLTDPAFWARKQARVRSGIQEDVFSYPEAMRFRRRPQPTG